VSPHSHMARGRRPRLALLAGTLLTLLFVAAPRQATDPVTLLYFGADGCPYCTQMQVFLDDLERRFGDDLEVVRHDVSGDQAARARWVRELTERGHQPSGVPTAILGEQVWIGFDVGIGDRITSAVAAAIADRAPVDEEARVDAPDAADPPETPDTALDVPFLGSVDAAAHSALAATAMIAFIDGFNPCSLWVLVVLLGMVLNAGATRRRIALIGGTFLMVTGLIYGAFIAGVFTVIGFIEHLGALRVGVASIALFVGAVNVKDHLAYKKGLSFTIPDRFKPRIYRSGRSIRDTDRPLAAVLGTTIAMAVGISLVELPCTAGFPVIWSGILRTQGVGGAEFGALLTLYLLIYVLDELVLFGAVLVTLKIGRFEERHGRLLKLVGGMVMIALGIVLLAAPQLMSDLAAATLVILGAVAAAFVFDRIHRKVTAEIGR
jgi:thiol-disulfide isomerase/thioredoxin